MPSSLSKNIFQTIVYYDILNYPLTSFEIWKYLVGSDSCSLGDVIEILDGGGLEGRVEEHLGFYFLQGRKDLAERRIQNNKNSIEKYKIAKRVARWLKFVPYVRMAAITGTLAMKNPEKRSDIDFFVVLQEGRIWTGRFLVTLAVQLLGKRRYGSKIKNRICLNYFVTDGSLEIKRQDLFAANEYSFIYPLLGLDIFQKFCEKNSKWINKLKPNMKNGIEYQPKFKIVPNRFQKTLERLINFLGGDIIEYRLKRILANKIEKNPLTRKEEAYVEYTDGHLVFLPSPQGPKVLQEFEKRLLTEQNIFL